jgi:hypothetical protein
VADLPAEPSLVEVIERYSRFPDRMPRDGTASLREFLLTAGCGRATM